MSQPRQNWLRFHRSPLSAATNAGFDSRESRLNRPSAVVNAAMAQLQGFGSQRTLTAADARHAANIVRPNTLIEDTFQSEGQ